MEAGEALTCQLVRKPTVQVNQEESNQKPCSCRIDGVWSPGTGLTPGTGTSTCCECGRQKETRKREREGGRERERKKEKEILKFKKSRSVVTSGYEKWGFVV